MKEKLSEETRAEKRSQKRNDDKQNYIGSPLEEKKIRVCYSRDVDNRESWKTSMKVERKKSDCWVEKENESLNKGEEQNEKSSNISIVVVLVVPYVEHVVEIVVVLVNKVDVMIVVVEV